MVRWFPPVVTGTVVLVIGISLMRVGINWAAGGNPTISTPNGPMPNPAYGLPVNLAIAGIVLLTVIGINAFLKGFVVNISALIGIIVGFVIALVLGKISFAGVATAGWFQPILPFQFGLPTFDLMSAITLCVVMVVMMIEGVGQFMALAEITGHRLTKNDVARGLRADGLGNIIGSIFNTFTYTSYAQNVGLVQVTGVRSRWVCAMAGGILVVLGCLPKLAFFAASIPQYVLGGAAVVMFGMVAATGIKILAKVNFVENNKNLYIVAISVGAGMISVVSDKFFAQLPELVAKFCQNGILLGTLTAVLLNMLFNGGGRGEEEFTLADHPAEAGA
jgi:NCS2 family nucleobase:cation symporter-2